MRHEAKVRSGVAFVMCLLLVGFVLGLGGSEEMVGAAAVVGVIVFFGLVKVSL